MARTFRDIASVVALACALTACASTSTTPETQSLGSQSANSTLTWTACGSDFECATLRVPVSYDSPDGSTLGINVVRLPATGDRLGSLVVNPGGPGASGIDYARAAEVIVSAEVRSHFDIVGFDPRGVGSSTPIHCFTGDDLDFIIGADATPDDAADLAALKETARIVREGCGRNDADLVAHLSTQDAARDLDRLRAALGERRLDYLGKSYGTFLGATYADLFPSNVGRFVLDGVLPPDLDGDALALGQARGFEDALARFLADCLARSACPFSGNLDSALGQFDAFLASLERAPLPTLDDQRPLTEALATYAVLMNLYSPQQWPSLRDGLTAARAGSGDLLLEQLDARLSRAPDGTYADNSMDAFYAVSCTDRPMTTEPSELAMLATRWSLGVPNTPAPAPLLGEYFAWSNIACDGWGFPSGTPPHAISAAGSAPILVVSTAHDPATPYEWGVRLADQLDNARLVSYDGDGHTAYRKGSACVDKVVDAYLIKGTVPSSDVSC